MAKPVWITGCTGGQQNRTADMDVCKERGCDKLVHSTKTQIMTVIAASCAPVDVHMAEFPPSPLGALGSELVAVSVRLPGEHVVHVYLDKQEVVEFLTTQSTARQAVLETALDGPGDVDVGRKH